MMTYAPALVVAIATLVSVSVNLATYRHSVRRDALERARKDREDSSGEHATSIEGWRGLVDALERRAGALEGRLMELEAKLTAASEERQRILAELDMARHAHAEDKRDCDKAIRDLRAALGLGTA